MRIKELVLKKFRNYDHVKLEFSPSINFIIGENGTGKTNILEGITVASSLRSFRNIHDTDIIKWGETSYFTSVLVDDNEYSKFEVGCVAAGAKIRKKAKIDGIEIKSVSSYFGKLITVVYSPSDINIINESPELRRRFFDSVISKTDRQYLETLGEFKKILASRNKLLKNLKEQKINSSNELDVWDQLFAEKASVIIKKRLQFLEEFNRIFHSSYVTISDEENPPFIMYSGRDESVDTSTLLRTLISMRKRDIILGSTGTGPQRDDFVFNLSRGLFINYASQGQKRTAAICLRLSETGIVEKIKGKKSIILVDDIFSELDKKRRKNMIDILHRENQILFTMVNADIIRAMDFSDFDPGKTFNVSSPGIISGE